MKRRFFEVDVFASEALRGNPLAVVVDAQGLSDAQMQDLARWTNFSETSFILPPTDARADYWVRIFTPGGELPFAGHPTLGTAYAYLASGAQPRQAGCLVQQCGVGLVRVKLQGPGRFAFDAPPLKRQGAVTGSERQQALDSLGLQSVLDLQWVDNGQGWMAARLDTAEQVLALRPDFQRMRGLKLGVIAPHAKGADADFEVRAFVPALGIPEDPVTGGLQASLARWLIPAGLAPDHYVAAQGAALGRAGRVSVDREGDAIWIGGQVLPVVEGLLTL
ncbi:PhzF family phenazine biosynthesis protein [Inhella inkyongensis]|uniref:PhzF family phenazine biosynthesis protein n=1 Tax=Inhella inkyongensis TaxID=392593 RepID=A0A840S801_9BURK|nr:PhzF family phenazine biosynthesis protein [Inhella inkyongensis]MBB5205742.1 PhzF family phenazine biosynthesis protein [Inhella inkyongensis]